MPRLSLVHKSTGVGGNIAPLCLSLQKDVSWECLGANVGEQKSLARGIEQAGLPRWAERRERSLDEAGCAEANYTVRLIERVDSLVNISQARPVFTMKRSNQFWLWFSGALSLLCFLTKHNGSNGKKVLHLHRKTTDVWLESERKIMDEADESILALCWFVMLWYLLFEIWEAWPCHQQNFIYKYIHIPPSTSCFNTREGCFM